MTDLREKINRILIDATRVGKYLTYDRVTDDILSLLHTEMMGVIGKDKTWMTDEPCFHGLYPPHVERNQLRSEQRKRLDEVMGKEKKYKDLGMSTDFGEPDDDYGNK